jgi:hypothetical protein
MSVSQNYPIISPSLSMDFAAVKALDPRVTFTRASSARYYNGVTTTKAEENLFVGSTLPDNSSFGLLDNATKTASQTGPDGSTNANLLNEGTATGSHQFRTTTGNLLTTPANTDFTVSFFVKDVDTQYVAIAMFGAFNNYRTVEFDLTAGTVNRNAGANVTLVASSITSIGDSWYRCALSYNTADTTTKSIRIGFSDGTTSLVSTTGLLPSITGTSRTFFLFGPQAEIRSSATAYTPTTTQPITNYIPVLETAASGVARFDHNPTTFESLGLLIEQQSTNLLTYSEDFTNAIWGKSNVTVTANTIVALDGALTGDKVLETAATGRHEIFRSPSVLGLSASTTFTFSIQAKAAERSAFIVFFSTGEITGNPYAIFDLATGTVHFSSGTTASMTLSGNGFYRCSLTGVTASTTITPIIGILNALSTSRLNSYTGDGYSGIYIWGAQLEAGAFPTSYIPTVASQVTRSADAASMTGANFSSWYNAAEGTLYGEASASLSTNKVIFSIDLDSNNNTNIRYTGSTTGVARAAYNTAGVAQADITSAVTDGVRKIGFAYKVNDFALTANAASPTTDLSGTVFSGTAAYIGYTPAFGTALNGTIKKIAYYSRRLSNAELQALTS